MKIISKKVRTMLTTLLKTVSIFINTFQAPTSIGTQQANKHCEQALLVPVTCENFVF